MWLFLAFLLVPLLEIGLFIQVGGAIGLWPTLAIVVLTAAAGTWLVRAQGRQAIEEVRGSFGRLRDPTRPLAHGAMILISGALLLTPGFFTDAVGFALLIPKVRDWLMAFAGRRIAARRAAGRAGGFAVEGDWRPVEPDPGPAGAAPARGPDLAKDAPPTPGPRGASSSRPAGGSGWTRGVADAERGPD